MSKTTTYLLTALVSSIVLAALILAVVATPLAYADEKDCNPQGSGTGNPHDDGETGNPHDDGETGNPHHHCHHH
jgi:hypothetical protein